MPDLDRFTNWRLGRYAKALIRGLINSVAQA